MIVSGFTAALDLDTYPHSNFIHPRCAERAKLGRGKPVLSMHIGFLAVFTLYMYLLNAVVLVKLPRFFLALVALKLLVSLISHLVTCSARIVVDRQTDRQTKRLL